MVGFRNTLICWITSPSPCLTHWGRATHICVSELTIIGSDNGLSPGRRQAIIWTIAGILWIGPLGTNFNEILIEIYTFSFRKIHLKTSSGKWRPFCLGLNVLSNNGLQVWIMSCWLHGDYLWPVILHWLEVKTHKGFITFFSILFSCNQAALWMVQSVRIPSWYTPFSWMILSKQKNLHLFSSQYIYVFSCDQAALRTLLSVCPSVTRQKPQINGSVVLGAYESPWPCGTPVCTLHSLEWFWVSRRIFIYSHHNTFVFYSKTSIHLSHLSHLYHYVPTIVSSWNCQELLAMTEVRCMQKFKFRGQRSMSQR